MSKLGCGEDSGAVAEEGWYGNGDQDLHPVLDSGVAEAILGGTYRKKDK